MALPTLSKTWQFNTNLTSAGNAALETQSDDLILMIKNLLKGSQAGFTNSAGGGITPTGSWQVRSSCNGAGAFGNGDLVDRWSTITDIVHAAAGNNHSWVVLRQTGIGSLYEILLDANNASTNALTVIVSATGFGTANGGADGTATAAPTASSSITLQSAGTTWGATGSTSILTRVHYMCSSDGALTHLLMFRNSFLCAWWCFMKPDQAQPWWTIPWVGGVFGTNTATPGSNVPTQTDIAQTTSTNFLKSRHVSTNLDMKLGCVGFNNAPGIDFTVANPDGNNPIFGLRVLSNTLAFTGDHAFCPDLWMGRTGLSNGSGYPNPGPSQFMQIGNMIFPWNQSVIQIA